MNLRFRAGSSVIAIFLACSYEFSSSGNTILEKELSYFPATGNTKSTGEGETPDRRSARYKLSDIWMKILRSRYRQLPAQYSPGMFGSVNILIPDHYYRNYSRDADTLYTANSSPVYRYGSVAKVSWIAHKGHPYTGIFRSGAEHALLRLSMAWKPVNGTSIPGTFLKVFVDNHNSLDLKLASSGDPVQGTSFFSHSMQNLVSAPDSTYFMKLYAAAVESAFRVTGHYTGSPFSVSPGPLSLVNETGIMQDKQVTPYRITFRPTLEAHNLTKGGREADPRAQINGKGAGTVLYLIFASSLAKDPLTWEVKESEEKLIGFLKAESHFLSSGYADDYLYFRHNIMQL